MQQKIYKANTITRDGSYIEFEYKFKRGDVVHFLYIDEKTGKKTLVKNSRITNSWFEDPALYNNVMGPSQTYKCYYFYTIGESIQGVWIPENQVFDRNDVLAETLYGG